MLHEIKSHNIVSFLLESDIEEANNANIVDPDDDENVDIELWTASLGFVLAQNRLVSFPKNLFCILLH